MGGINRVNQDLYWSNQERFWTYGWTSAYIWSYQRYMDIAMGKGMAYNTVDDSIRPYSLETLILVASKTGLTSNSDSCCKYDMFSDILFGQQDCCFDTPTFPAVLERRFRSHAYGWKQYAVPVLVTFALLRCSNNSCIYIIGY